MELAKTSRSEAKSVDESRSSKRFDHLLKVINRSLETSRNSIWKESHSLIRECYGDSASLFASNDDDNDENDNYNEEKDRKRKRQEEGTAILANLLMGVVDRFHDRFTSQPDQLPQLLHPRIFDLLTRLDEIIDDIDLEDERRRLEEEQDKFTAKAALEAARLPQLPLGDDGQTDTHNNAPTETHNNAPTETHNNAHTDTHNNAQTHHCTKKRSMLPAEWIGYHAYQLKQHHHDDILSKIDQIADNNQRLEQTLQQKQQEWEKTHTELLNLVHSLQSIQKEVDGDMRNETKALTDSITIPESKNGIITTDTNDESQNNSIKEPTNESKNDMIKNMIKDMNEDFSDNLTNKDNEHNDNNNENKNNSQHDKSI